MTKKEKKGKPTKGIIYNEELNHAKKIALKLANEVQEKNKNKVKVIIDNSTYLLVDKKTLKEKGKDIIIQEYLDKVKTYRAFNNTRV